MSHSWKYVGLILLGNERAKNLKSEKVPRSFSLPLQVCFLLRRIPRGSLPALPGTFPAQNVQILTFPISDAKVLLFFDMTKFFGKKMTKYVVKHKKERFLPLFSLTKFNADALSIKSRYLVIRRQSTTIQKDSVRDCGHPATESLQARSRNAADGLGRISFSLFELQLVIGE